MKRKASKTNSSKGEGVVGIRARFEKETKKKKKTAIIPVVVHNMLLHRGSLVLYALRTPVVMWFLHDVLRGGVLVWVARRAVAFCWDAVLCS